MNIAQFNAHQGRLMTDCQVCSRKQEQHYAAVTGKLVKGCTAVGAGIGTLFFVEGMTTSYRLFRRDQSLVRNLHTGGLLTFTGAILGCVLGQGIGTIYRDTDMIFAALSKRKCTCLPAQPS